MDDQEDIAEEVPKLSDRGATDAAAGSQQSPAADPAAADATEAVPGPEAEPDVDEVEAAPRLYQLRRQGLRPVRRHLRRHGLRNDCPPDLRHHLRSPSSRTRVR